MKAEAPLSEDKILESESALYNYGIFDWVSVEPRRPITDQTSEEVLVKVHEAKAKFHLLWSGPAIHPEKRKPFIGNCGFTRPAHPGNSQFLYDSRA